jgi:hypothetical protein
LRRHARSFVGTCQLTCGLGAALPAARMDSQQIVHNQRIADRAAIDHGLGVIVQ